MKYQSEIIKNLIENKGHHVTTNPHYEVDCINEIINDVRGSYPKLCDYMGEWMNYANEHMNIGKFPIERVTDVTNARFENVVPYGYKSAILKGCTGYCDIDTGEILETFEEGRNLELVSVKMPVLTTQGKNWIDIRKSVDGFLPDSRPYDIAIPDNFDKTSDYTKVEPNTTYCYSVETPFDGTHVSRWFFYKDIGVVSSEVSVRKMASGVTKMVITTPSDCNYIRICSRGLMLDGATAQLEKSPTPTTHEPYKSSILTVNEPIELRGIGDVQDTLDCLTGEVTERIGEVVLDGSENWRADGGNELYSRFIYSISDVRTKWYKVLSDKFIGAEINSLDGEKIYRNGYGRVNGIVISNNKLENLTVDGLKAYLMTNPVTVQYELEESIVKTVDLSCLDENNTPTKFKPYEGVMYVQTSSETLPPLLDMEVPVEAINQNLASFIK